MNLTPNDVRLAESKVRESSETINQRIGESFQFVLVPQQEAGKRVITWHQSKPSGNGSLFERISKKLESEEKLISSYGGTRVRMDLDRVPLWKERGDISVADLWKAYSEFPYMTRLASIDVLIRAIGDGVASLRWSLETFAYADAHDGSKWVGMVAAQNATVRSSGLLVRPDFASIQLEANTQVSPSVVEGIDPPVHPAGGGSQTTQVSAPKTRYYGRFNLDTTRGVRQLASLLTDVISHLEKAGGSVDLNLEVNSSGPGFDDRVQRVVRENSQQLGVESQEFE